MQKKKSFVNEILKYLVLLTGLLIIILGIFLISSFDILENEIKDASASFLKIYSNEMHNSITAMDNILKSITTQGENLEKIKSRNENARAIAAMDLHNYMKNLIIGKDADAIVVYDSNYHICLDAAKAGIVYKAKNILRDFTGKAVDNQDIPNYQWGFMDKNNEIYMYKMLKKDTRVIAIYVRTSNLLNLLSTSSKSNRSIMLVNDLGIIEKVWDNKSGEIKQGANISEMHVENYYISKKSIVEDQLTIYCYTRKNSIFQQIYVSMMVVAITVCLAVLLMLFVLRFTRNEIAVPMHQIVNDMEKITTGAYENRINGTYHTMEFQMLQDTTNRMVDEIIGLKIQTYEKRIALQGMELKSIRLQLKPHFFLNALTTISSLSGQNKNEQIKTYIEALSKNIRYMFRAGFHTVPVREEIRHVENYFEMQELKYPGCIFYLIDLPKELEDWKIPQMLIHTFIENAYKHAVCMDENLTILIKISSQVYEGKEMLLIEIEDDGKGYPKEVLAYMSDRMEKSGEKGKRIGLWSIKRMMELMYEREDLLYLENIEPHGCLSRIYVPAKAKHELEEKAVKIKRQEESEDV